MASELETLVDAIISRAEPFGSSAENKSKKDAKRRDKQRKVVAAGALVIRERGLDWATADVAACQSAVTDLLSSGGWISALLGLFGIVSPWVTLIAALIPILVGWFSERNAAGLSLVGPGLATECERELRR